MFDANTLVGRILDAHPYAEEVLEWHGLPIDDAARDMALHALCWVHARDVEEILDELRRVEGVGRPEDWRSYVGPWALGARWEPEPLVA